MRTATNEHKASGRPVANTPGNTARRAGEAGLSAADHLLIRWLSRNFGAARTEFGAWNAIVLSPECLAFCGRDFFAPQRWAGWRTASQVGHHLPEIFGSVR